MLLRLTSVGGRLVDSQNAGTTRNQANSIRRPSSRNGSMGIIDFSKGSQSAWPSTQMNAIVAAATRSCVYCKNRAGWVRSASPRPVSRLQAHLEVRE